MKYLLIALIVMCSSCSVFDTVDKQAVKDCIKDEVVKVINEEDGE